MPVLFFLAVVLGFSIGALAEDNLLRNGNLTEGPDDAPSDWSRVSHGYLNPTQAAETFQWTHAPGAPGEVKLTSSKHTIRKWQQTMNLPAGSYYLSGEIRSELKNPLTDSSNISLQLSKNAVGLSWPNKANPSDWKKGTLYFKVGKPRKDADVACILMGLGAVSCRNIKLIKLSSPPPAGTTVIDLDTFKEQVNSLDLPRPFPKPTGQPWTLFATMLSLVALAFLGWIALGPRHN